MLTGENNLPALLFSFCMFALIDPADNISYSQFFVMCYYLHFLAGFCWSASSSKLN